MLAELFSLFLSTTSPAPVQGYVEADVLRLGVPASGRLASLTVREGEDVPAGMLLFSLDSSQEEAALAEAEAGLAQSESVLANLQKGLRPDELEALRQQRREAEASLRLARQTLARQQSLGQSQTASRQAVDAARAAAETALARRQQLTASLRQGEQGARPDEIAAQQAVVRQHQAAVAVARRKLEDRSARAPVAARVDDLYFRPGEVVATATPVLSLIPPDNIKLVFFVDEPRLAAVQVGQEVGFDCDGCAAMAQQARSSSGSSSSGASGTSPLRAVVTFVARQAEYTPPVIYSVNNRAKLVYRVEARPPAALRPLLHPGQPVDVLP